MRLPRKFDVQSAFVLDSGKSGTNLPKVDIADAKRQMLVPAHEHVIDVDVDNPAAALPDHGGGWPFPHAGQVSDVDGEPQVIGPTAPIHQSGVAGKRVDEHAGFGLESERHAASRRVIEHRLDPIDQSLPEGFLIGGIPNHPRPERHAAGSKTRGDVDGPPEKINSPLTGRTVSRDECRLVLVPRIEKVPGAGLDDARHPESIQGGLPPRRFGIEAGGEGVEEMAVDRDRQ